MQPLALGGVSQTLTEVTDWLHVDAICMSDRGSSWVCSAILALGLYVLEDGPCPLDVLRVSFEPIRCQSCI